MRNDELWMRIVSVAVPGAMTLAVYWLGKRSARQAKQHEEAAAVKVAEIRGERDIRAELWSRVERLETRIACLEAENEKLIAQRMDAQLERQELHGEIDRMRGENDALREKVRDLEAQVRDLSARLAQKENQAR